jgi:hypothetical protein
MTQVWKPLLRGLLWVLLVPAAVFAFMMLVSGLTFGFALWSARDPLPTVLWLATLALPIIIVVVLNNSQRSMRELLFSAVACWGFAAWYLLSLTR